jgi:hypothetical protein
MKVCLKQSRSTRCVLSIRRNGLKSACDHRNLLNIWSESVLQWDVNLFRSLWTTALRADPSWRNAYKILLGKTAGNRQIRTHKLRGYDITVHLKHRVGVELCKWGGGGVRRLRCTGAPKFGGPVWSLQTFVFFIVIFVFSCNKSK